MAVETPSLLDGVSLDSGNFRRILHAALGGGPGGFAGGIGALDGAAHGVCGATHLKVSQSGTPAMSVDVAAGLASIRGTESAALGPFPFYNDAPVTLTIAAAHATLERWDLVIAQIRLADTPRLAVVTGTPAGSPTNPSLAAFPNALVLARVRVPGADTSITDAQIDDLRTWAGVFAPKPLCQARSGGVVLTNGVTAAVAFDTEDLDGHGWHSTSVNPERVTPTIPGWYRVTARARMASDTDYTRFLVLIQRNGAEVHRAEANPVVTGGAPSTLFSTPLIQMNGSTDYLELAVNQANTSGGANTVIPYMLVELVHPG